jgi:2-polyprenyl-6-methoxyphenol hydroxylase-like FAD-dependent oxidoreductase
VGASIAGLLATRVLADHFDHVTLIDRDTKPSTPAPRKGIPQGNHVHNLLLRGMRILEAFFPGFIEEATAAGAPMVDVGREFLWYQHFGWKLHVPGHYDCLFMSRPLLEAILDRRVQALPNVVLRDRTAVRTFRLGSNGVVSGVSLDDGTELEADLLVDATGRGSQLPKWLQRVGYPAVSEARVKIDLGYASRRFRRQPGVPDGGTSIGDRWLATAVIPTAPQTRGAAAFPIEGDEWLVTLLGWVRDHPPADEEGFRDFAKSLPMSVVYETIIRTEPTSDIVLHRFPSNFRRYYERATLPRRLLVVGDSVCSFNPGFGQGMTVAAMQVEAVAHELGEASESLDDALRRAQKKIGRIVDIPWDVVVNEDLRHEATVGERNLRNRMIQWYSTGLMRGANRDAKLAATFMDLAHFTCSPNIVLRPDIAARILFHCVH